ncbi:MAG: hypothetical protein G8D89_22335 [gamma proteobacterium symbiont of Clathrolucina costata]
MTDKQAMGETISAYLSWLNGITAGEFEYIMRKSGHKDNSYIREKWVEFERNKLMFSWNWHEEMFAYYGNT